jgi:hypothetical protein
MQHYNWSAAQLLHLIVSVDIHQIYGQCNVDARLETLFLYNKKDMDVALKKKPPNHFQKTFTQSSLSCYYLSFKGTTGCSLEIDSILVYALEKVCTLQQ